MIFICESSKKQTKRRNNMSSSNKTSLGLNAWSPSDKPVRQDFVDDNIKIDEQITKLNRDLGNNIVSAHDGKKLKLKYVKYSCPIVAGVKYQGKLNFASIGIEPSKVLDCFLAPHNSLPNDTFMSVRDDNHYAWSNTYTGTVVYGLLVIYQD